MYLWVSGEPLFCFITFLLLIQYHCMPVEKLTLWLVCRVVRYRFTALCSRPTFCSDLFRDLSRNILKKLRLIVVKNDYGGADEYCVIKLFFNL